MNEVWYRQKTVTRDGSTWEWADWRIICAYSTEADAIESLDTFQKINPAREYKLVKTACSN